MSVSWLKGLVWVAFAVIAVVVVELLRRRRLHREESARTLEITWSVLATYASAIEADLVIELLHGAEIPTFRQGSDMGAIFGAGSQGATASGIAVLVPTEALEDARALVAGE
jgi:hypothetical protein